ncbi:exported hypothetical protein [Candidatus Contendobacter odensis Run_B_J11]|uniref:Uncharacterized protein n=1 Tax=Candidatus Contendobacter odensis Run_B_J11 TaxID=1400861 RepID=A0A7U7G906_9GAMM|nr:exported hypothetical protein [Candidatus Contendobacter odensis Run_B_J11]
MARKQCSPSPVLGTAPGMASGQSQADPVPDATTTPNGRTGRSKLLPSSENAAILKKWLTIAGEMNP